MKAFRQIGCMLVLSLGVTGCAFQASNYSPNFSTVGEVQSLDLPSMATGEFSAANNSVNKVTVRANPMKSPYGSYSNYLKAALEEDLRASNLWDSKSTIVIKGSFKSNMVDGSGASTGEAKLAAEFVVIKDGVEVYRKTHTAEHTWESSFVGAIAIPNAANNYPVAVQKLLAAFLTDPELAKAVK